MAQETAGGSSWIRRPRKGPATGRLAASPPRGWFAMATIMQEPPMARGGAGEARKGPNRGRNGDRRPADNPTSKFGWAGNRRTIVKCLPRPDRGGCPSRCSRCQQETLRYQRKCYAAVGHMPTRCRGPEGPGPAAQCSRRDCGWLAKQQWCCLGSAQSFHDTHTNNKKASLTVEKQGARGASTRTTTDPGTYHTYQHSVWGECTLDPRPDLVTATSGGGSQSRC